MHSLPHIHSFLHTPIIPSHIHSFLQTLISIHSFISSHTHQFLHTFTPSPIIPSHILQFLHILSFIHTFIHPLFPHTFIHSLIPHTFIHSLTIHAFTPQKFTFSKPHSLTYPCIHSFPGSEGEFIPIFTPSLPPSSRILPLRIPLSHI